MTGTDERDPGVRRLLAGIAARHEPPEEGFTRPPAHVARHRRTGTWQRKALALRLRSVTRRGDHR